MYILVSPRKNRRIPTVSAKVMESVRVGSMIEKRSVKYLGTAKIDQSKMPSALRNFLFVCNKKLIADAKTKKFAPKLSAELESKISPRFYDSNSERDTNIKLKIGDAL